MILLPDEDGDELPAGAQVKAVIGEGLRQSVDWAELSPGFEARLTAALDAVERGRAGIAGPPAASQAASHAASHAAGAGEAPATGPAVAGDGQGAKVEVAAS
jgi:hypothetical protein